MKTTGEKWKLVPVEPTLEMVVAWVNSQKPSDRTVEAGYRAMLAAAPTPPQQQEQSGEASIGLAIELLERSAAPFDEACMILRQLSPDTATASQESLGTTQEAVKFPGKIERHCPRCRTHAFHWLTRNGEPSALKNTKLHTATCANCGHQWPCRVMGKDL